MLRTLGRLEIEGSHFTQQKPLLLLAYLAIEGPKPRRYLADLFFIETQHPLNSLSRSLSYLRKYDSTLIESDHRWVQTRVECDSVRFNQLFYQGGWKECLWLYKGSFVADITIKLSIELEEWLYQTREIMAVRAQQAHIELSQKARRQGHFQQALFLAERAYQLADTPELEDDKLEDLYVLLQAGASPWVRKIRKEACELDARLVSGKR